MAKAGTSSYVAMAVRHVEMAEACQRLAFKAHARGDDASGVQWLERFQGHMRIARQLVKDGKVARAAMLAKRARKQKRQQEGACQKTSERTT
jgi:hypothetical protein